jgi:hypothetical protein
VEKLSFEVSRLRLMVERVTERQNAINVGRSASEESSAQPGAVHLHRDPFQVPLPLPGSPVHVLPTIFSGQEGTARLFRLLLDTYAWLEPPEMKEARELIARDKERQAKLLDDLEREALDLRKKQEEMERAHREQQLAAVSATAASGGYRAPPTPRGVSPSPTVGEAGGSRAAPSMATPRGSKLIMGGEGAAPLSLTRPAGLGQKQQSMRARQSNILKRMVNKSESDSDEESKQQSPLERKPSGVLERKSSVVKPSPMLDTEF